MPVLLDFVPATVADIVYECLPVYDDHFIGNLKINQNCSFTEFTDMVQEYRNDDYNSLLSVLHVQDCRYIYLSNDSYETDVESVLPK